MKKMITIILSALCFGVGVGIYTNNVLLGIFITLGVYYFGLLITLIN